MKYKYRKDISINGRRYSIRANTARELMEKEIKKRIEIEQGGVIDSDMTLKAWADRCVETYKTKQNEITRTKYMNRMNHCILNKIGDMRLKEIKPLHCQQVLNEQAGKSKTQVNEIYQQLRFLFRHAVSNGLLKSDPTENIIKPDYRIGHRRALTGSERRFFIKVGLQDRRYYYYMLMLFCGCRPSEARAVMGYDILTLSNGLPALHIRGTKTENSDRVVPIPLEFYEYIRNTKPDEPVAMTAKGGPITENNRARIWNSYTRQINIEMGCKTYRNALVPPYPLAPDLVPYCLRHEYCTELARRGVDIRIAQKLMGHSDIQLTANIYTNLNNNDVADIAEMLSKKCRSSAALKGVKSYKNVHSNTEIQTKKKPLEC